MTALGQTSPLVLIDASKIYGSGGEAEVRALNAINVEFQSSRCLHSRSWARRAQASPR